MSEDMTNEEIIESAKDYAKAMIEEYESVKDDKEYLKTDYCEDDQYICVYYGDILYLNPSGKFYTCWTTNQTDDDVEDDQLFWDTINEIIEPLGLWVESGEGNACDIMICGAYVEPEYYHVSDIPDDYQLITDSQDIKALCESIGLDYWEYGDGCFFVLVCDGEYTSVYYCDYQVPHLDYNVERIELP